MITNDNTMPDSAKSLLNNVAQSLGTSQNIIARQLIIWTSDKVLEAKENLKYKFSERDIAIIEDAFCSILCSINSDPDIKKVCSKIPRNEAGLRAAVMELDQFEILYFVTQSMCAIRNNKNINMINASEFGKRMIPPRTNVAVINHIKNGRIPGVRKNLGNNLWLLPSNYAVILSKEIERNMQARKKSKKGE